MKKKTRLISVQGPGQLLNVLGILNYQQEAEGYNQYEDHLVLGGFSTNSKKQTQAILKACQRLACFWNFQSITSLNVERLRGRQFFQKVRQAKWKLDLDTVDTLYVCRNWQLFNEVLLEAYVESHKICYGDGFGWLDLNDTKWQALPINPKGYAKINSAYLFMPVAADSAAKSFDLVDKIVQPPIGHLIQTIHNIALGLDDLKNFCLDLKSKSSQEFTLVVTSNFTEAGSIKDKQLTLGSKDKKLYIDWNREKFHQLISRLSRLMYIGFPLSNLLKKPDPDLEAAMYFEQVMRYCSNNDVIIIKPHPRETLGQATLLAQKLLERGCQPLEIDKSLAFLPIELFASLLPFSKIICMNSSSSISLALISNIESNHLFALIDQDLRDMYIDEKLKISKEDADLVINLLEQAFEKNFIPTRKTISHK